MKNLSSITIRENNGTGPGYNLARMRALAEVKVYKSNDQHSGLGEYVVAWRTPGMSTLVRWYFKTRDAARTAARRLKRSRQW